MHRPIPLFVLFAVLGAILALAPLLLPATVFAQTTSVTPPVRAAITALMPERLSSTNSNNQVVAGFDHTCALTKLGTMECWGLNAEGQLGDGTTDNRSTPVNVVGLGNDVAGIAVGSSHTCALTVAKGVKCWGNNFFGQLGDGTRLNNRLTPVDVVGLTSGVAAIAAGGNHTCALTTGGAVKCWGNNSFSQLGDGTSGFAESKSSPVDVVGLDSGVTAISAGDEHTCALTADGEAKCWGHNSTGQLGDGTTTPYGEGRPIPVDVVGLHSNVVAITTGGEHTCAVTEESGAKCWGNNRSGQLGDGSGGYSLIPVDVVGLNSGVAAIVAGQSHTCAVTTEGGLKCWGDNGYGQLGDETTTNRNTPTDVFGLGIGVTFAAAGRYHSCAMTIDDKIRCWGANYVGQLGDGTGGYKYTPVSVVGLDSDISAIASTWYHTCALTSKGSVKCWGGGHSGSLGDGTTNWSTVPVDVVGIASGATAIAAGGSHGCAVISGSGIKCWGYGYYGQLGDGSGVNQLTPVNVLGLSNGVVSVTTGGNHTCALITTGSVKCWGSNSQGQLGDGTTTQRNTPVDVVGLGSSIASITAGNSHTCALTTLGGVKCWGSNTEGQLGDNTTTNSSLPVDVIGLNNGVTAVSASGMTTCALTESGGAKCWGDNQYGQLGDGTTSSRHTPVDVAGLSNGLAALNAGFSHSCALTNVGGAKCWGDNEYGQLGHNTEKQSLIPVDVMGLSSGVVGLAVGWDHTCALSVGGGVKCWGNTTSGQLGDGTSWRVRPVDVVHLVKVYLPSVANN